MRSVLAAVLLALGLVVVGPSTAYACSCIVSTPAELLDRADVVVLGTVADREPARSDGTVAAVSYVLDVQRVYKGQAGLQVEFATSGSSASCGLDLVVSDRPRVVFLTRADGVLTGSCLRGHRDAHPCPGRRADRRGHRAGDPRACPTAQGVGDPAAAVGVPAAGGLGGNGGSDGGGTGPGGALLAAGSVVLLAALATTAGVATGALRRRAEVRG